MNQPGLTAPPFAWWAAQRFRYNVLLVGAAPVSLVCLLVVWWLFEERLPCLEVTLFSLFFGAVFFGVGLGLANVCYYLGPLSEKLLRPSNVSAFRRAVFGLGVGFSLLLIFSPVIGSLVAALLGPAASGQCG
jgi:hypothetical protein